jgi:hypothetical protein
MVSDGFVGRVGSLLGADPGLVQYSGYMLSKLVSQSASNSQHQLG